MRIRTRTLDLDHVHSRDRWEILDGPPNLGWVWASRALEALWLRDGRGGPGLEFFRGVVPARDLGPFEHFFLGLLEKKSQEWMHAAGNRADPH